MANPIEKLARRLLKVEREVLRLRSPQLGHSSIEDGAVQEHDLDGNLVQVIGKQFDGTHTTTQYNGPTPPTPEAPLVEEVLAGLRIYWDGTFADGSVAPMDFARVVAYAVTDPENFDPVSPAQVIGTFETSAGGEFYAALPEVEHYVFLVTWTQSGKFSVESVAGFGTPQAPEAGSDPTEVPGSSPAVEVDGMPNSLMIVATDDVASSTQIQYHISTTPDFTPDSTTLLPGSPTRSTVYVAVAMPDGTPLAPNTTYYIKTIAENSVGEAMAGAEATGQLDLNAIEAVITEKLVAGFILTGSIQVGEMTIDADSGISIPQPDGTVTRFPVDGLTPATISGYLVASAGMTVKGDADFYGLTRMFGNMRIASGISDPSIPPDISFDNIGVQGTEFWSNSMHGLCPNVTDSNEVVSILWAFGASFRSFNKSTGARNTFIFEEISNVDDIGGVTSIPGVGYYVLAKRSGAWRVIAFNTDRVETGSWATGWPAITYRPTIGTDGTNVIVSHIGHSAGVNAGKPVVQIRNRANGAVSSTVVLERVVNRNLSGIATETVIYPYYWCAPEGSTVHTFMDFMGAAELPEETFKTGANGTSRGMFLDTGTGSLWTIDSECRIWEYTNDHTTASEIHASYTWVDNDATDGTHETAESPPRQTTWPARRRVIINGRPAPDAENTDPANHNKANLLSIYAGDPDAGVNPERRFQTTLALGETSATFESIANFLTVAPSVSTFTAGDTGYGSLLSEKEDLSGEAVWALRGDGSGRVGPHRWDADGEPTSFLSRVKYSRSDANQNIGTAWTDVLLNVEADDVNGDFTISGSTDITIPVSGIYVVSAQASWASGNAGRRGLRAITNGGVVIAMTDGNVPAGGGTSGIMGEEYLTAGTTVKLAAIQSGQTALAIANTFSPSFIKLRRAV